MVDGEMVPMEYPGIIVPEEMIAKKARRVAKKRSARQKAQREAADRQAVRVGAGSGAYRWRDLYSSEESTSRKSIEMDLSDPRQNSRQVREGKSKEKAGSTSPRNAICAVST